MKKKQLPKLVNKRKERRSTRGLSTRAFMFLTMVMVMVVVGLCSSKLVARDPERTSEQRAGANKSLSNCSVKKREVARYMAPDKGRENTDDFSIYTERAAYFVANVCRGGRTNDEEKE